MRISELSRAAGVPLPTVKYYLREGLLAPGSPTAPNQAEYGDAHLHRLRLIRALREIGGLRVAEVREVLDAVDDERVPVHRMLGVAHRALGPSDPDGPVAADVARARADVERWLDARGWSVSADAPARRSLADALVALRRLGHPGGLESFEPYADAAERIAAAEVGSVDGHGGRAEAVEQVVVGTVVFEAVLTALRRLAQEHLSRERFGAG